MALIKKLKETKAFFESLDSVEDQTFAEVVLEASGINIPLPTQEEVIAFYKEIGEPTNPLTTIDPKEWTTSQFLEYQSDIRKFQIKARLLNIKSAFKLKRAKNKEKQKKERKKFKLDFITSLFKDINENLSKNIPDDQKPKGVQKLGQLAGNITKVIAKTCIPSILNMIEQAALDEFEAKKLEVREELGIDEQLEQLSSLTDPAKLQEVKDKLCPTQDVLENIIKQRDGIVEFLNNQQVKVNVLRNAANITGNLADDLQNASIAIELSAFIANQLAKVATVGPVIAPLRSIITDLNIINQTIKFKQDGSPRLPPLRGAVSNFSLKKDLIQIL